ncbi:MAG TPA: hypothetical protein VF950_07240 [Planctomycetota bacterium]
MTAPARPRTGSLGCLGVFSVLCLTAFSAAELGIAWWLNASWFDRVAFWRAPRVEPEPVALEGKDAESAWARWRAEIPPPPPPFRKVDVTRPVLLHDVKATASYTPAAGAAVSDPVNGATVRVPAGALPAPARVTLTPCAKVPGEMAIPFAGPVYDLKIDDREHTAFQRPIELSLPYVKGLAKDDQVGIQVWENGRWRALPSRVDPVKGMVIATSPHASLFSVADLAKIAARIGFTATAGKLLAVLAIVAAGAENDTSRAAAFALYYGRSEEYETPEGNFKIHYYTYGSAKIPRDWEVFNDPFTPDTSGRTPVYVQRLGHWLEYCRKELHAEGFALPPAKLIRYDCFVVPDGETGGNLGASNISGPLFISPRIHELARTAAGGPYDPEAVMKSTCAHELLHVAQGKWYSTVKSEMPWSGVERLCEGDAEYNAWRFWRKRGLEDKFHESLVASTLALPAYSFDQTGETERYAYALWFEWMQHRFGEQTARDFLVAAHEGGGGSLSSMDAAAKKVLGGHGMSTLGEALAEFAADYYHRDWWTAKLCPKTVTTGSVSSGLTRYFDDGFGFGQNVKPDFITLARKTSDGSVARRPYKKVARAGIPHLSSRAVYMVTDTLVSDAKQPKPRLVIEFEGAAASDAALRVSLAKGTMDNPFGPGPAPGSEGEITAFPLAQGRVVLDGFGVKGQPNVVTLLVTNRSLDADLGGLTIKRWLLESPSFAQLELQTQGNDKWLLKWKPAPLEEHADVFSTYRIYRRPLHAAPEVKELVKDVRSGAANAELVQTELEGKDVADHRYAVAVVDVRGNESEPRDVELKDPFVGTWEGSFKLVDGSFVKPIMELIEKKGAEYDAKEEAAIRRIEEPDRRQRATRSLEENKKARAELSKLLNEFLGGAEEATRLGVPIEFQIRLDGGKYLFSVREILWGLLPLEKADRVETELKRAGKLTLRVPDMPEELPPMNFTLHRMDPEGKKPNIIREDNYVLQTTGEASKELPIRCVFRWDFERKSAENPPKP